MLLFCFCNYTATTQIYTYLLTRSQPAALPISTAESLADLALAVGEGLEDGPTGDAPLPFPPLLPLPLPPPFPFPFRFPSPFPLLLPHLFTFPPPSLLHLPAPLSPQYARARRRAKGCKSVLI